MVSPVYSGTEKDISWETHVIYRTELGGRPDFFVGMLVYIENSAIQQFLAGHMFEKRVGIKMFVLLVLLRQLN
jgi:hypothetical protein